MNAPSSVEEVKGLLSAAIDHIEDLRASLARIEREPIAIVGMACRLPGGVESPEDFWRLLERQGCSIAPAPAERLDFATHLAPWPGAPGRTYTDAGSYFARVDGFDAPYFAIGADEARALDPQHRFLLEASCHALENAGILKTDPLLASMGLVGSFGDGSYAELTCFAGNRANLGGHEKLGAAKSIGLGRIAHFLGLQGPVLEVDTSCSSSLVGLDLASTFLRTGKADLMLVGGANLILTPSDTIGFSGLRALSPTGTCAPFQARADGYVRGEGCAAVVLMRLSTALEAGARVYGVILGSAVNSDGRSNGLTAPNGLAQQAVIRRALAAAQVDPSDVRYIETHGTGTKLGDPIEAQSLARAYGCDGTRAPLNLGAVKGNIGHLESAAGLMAFIKATMAVQRGRMPANLLRDHPSELIDWNTHGLALHGEEQAWPPAAPAVAGVSGFGMSGTNVHLIVGAHPQVPVDEPLVPAGSLVLPVSAKSPQSLRQAVRLYAERLADDPAGAAALCSGAAHYRDAHAWRFAVTGATAQALAEALLAREAASPPVAAKRVVGVRVRTDVDVGDLLGTALAIERCEPPAVPLVVLYEDGSSLEVSCDFTSPPALAAALFEAGCDLAWTSVLPRVPKATALDRLPNYPFEHRSYWATPAQAPASAAPEAIASWKVEDLLSPDHLVHGLEVVPGAMLLVLAAQACADRFGLSAVVFEQVRFVRALSSKAGGDLVLDACATQRPDLIRLRLGGAETHLTADLRLRADGLSSAPPALAEVTECGDAPTLYGALRSGGLELAGGYIALASWSRNSSEIEWSMRDTNGASLAARLDGIFQAMASDVFLTDPDAKQDTLLPLEIGSIVLRPQDLMTARCVRSVRPADGAGRECTVASAVAHDGTRVVCSVSDMRFGRVPPSALGQARAPAPAAPREKVDAIVVGALIQEVIGITLNDAQMGIPLHELGLDSLGVYALQDAIIDRFDIDAPERNALFAMTTRELVHFSLTAIESACEAA